MRQCTKSARMPTRSTPRSSQARARARHARSRRAALPRASAGNACRPAASPGAATAAARCRDCSRSPPPSARRARGTRRAAAASFRAARGTRRAAAPRRCRAAAIARTPASRVCSTWSADRPPNSAASAAPPRSLSWSACSFTGRPSARAASNTRRVCAGEKPMPSQNASTASTRPSACSRGSQSHDRVDVVVGVARELRRQRMRGQVGRAHRDAERLADAARDAQHLAFVVEVQAVAGLDLERGHAVGAAARARAAATARSSSSSSAARTARTVDRMPPPARAISS